MNQTSYSVVSLLVYRFKIRNKIYNFRHQVPERTKWRMPQSTKIASPSTQWRREMSCPLTRLANLALVPIVPKGWVNFFWVWVLFRSFLFLFSHFNSFEILSNHADLNLNQGRGEQTHPPKIFIWHQTLRLFGHVCCSWTGRVRKRLLSQPICVYSINLLKRSMQSKRKKQISTVHTLSISIFLY